MYDRKLGIDSVINSTFSVMRINPVVFIILTAITIIPSTLIGLFAGDSASWANFLDTILTIIIQGALAYAVFQAFVGRKASLGESLDHGMARILSLIGIAFLAMLCLGAIFVIMFLTAFFIHPVFALSGIFVVILVCVWAVAVPACVVEQLGPIESLRRSAELTKGSRLIIFALYLIVGLIMVLILVVFTTIALAIVGELVGSILVAVVSIIPLAFISVMTAVIYYELRVIKEGVSAESIAGVFE